MSDRPSVVVVGSGAAGLTAALSAALTGASVTVLEATDRVGGTTALSGGVAWLPGNHRGPEAGFEDTPQDARTYLSEMSLGDVDDELLDVFLAEAGETARWLEEHSPLRLQSIAYPDYHDEKPGGTGGGRAVEPDPYPVDDEVEGLLRAPLGWRLRATQAEQMRGKVALELSRQREVTGVQTMGSALVACLLRAVLDAGVTVRTGARVTDLVVEDDVVVGARTDGVEVRGAVVLATGGFERDAALSRAFLRYPTPAAVGAPLAKGDGLRMAQSVGAALGNMSEAWWAPVTVEEGLTVDGEPMARLLLAERGRPGSIMVDRTGRRFCNEAQNYNDIGRALQSFDPGDFSFDRSPAWLLVDGEHRARYPVGPVLPGEQALADWVVADSVEELADGTGIDAAQLTHTLARFADQAAAGEDTDFGRGVSRYDRFVGDPDLPNPSLRALHPPFTALRVHVGTLGTKGGPRTTADGGVVRVDGSVVEGLFAVGNAAASPLGMAYPGAGGTIGPLLVFGRLAGRAAASGLSTIPSNERTTRV